MFEAVDQFHSEVLCEQPTAKIGLTDQEKKIVTELNVVGSPEEVYCF